MKFHLVGNMAIDIQGRTPRGVRGLKWATCSACTESGLVAPLAGCVD